AARPPSPIPPERPGRGGGVGREPYLDSPVGRLALCRARRVHARPRHPRRLHSRAAQGLQGQACGSQRNLARAGHLIRRPTAADASAPWCRAPSSANIQIMADKRRIPETLFDELGIRMTYEVERVIYELQTEHQHLVLFEHPFFGKMLMLDGATQVTSTDEFVYHEMMAHVPILAHGHAKEVLIVGGGDCGVAEEVLKHKSVKRLTQVEIDASVIEFA